MSLQSKLQKEHHEIFLAGIGVDVEKVSHLEMRDAWFSEEWIAKPNAFSRFKIITYIEVAAIGETPGLFYVILRKNYQILVDHEIVDD